MARRSKLLAALDVHKGRDFRREKQKKLQIQAEKRKKSQPGAKGGELAKSEVKSGERMDDSLSEGLEDKSDGWESDENTAALSEEPVVSVPLEDESDSESSLGGGHTNGFTEEHPEGNSTPNSPREDEEGQDIPLSDIESLASDDKADILPRQHLTINNTVALLAAHKSFALQTSLPFSTHQTLTTAAPIEISDVQDDLNRELAFYKQCLDAANEGRDLLQREGMPFSRPNDFFAEMVKTDEHMGKIKRRLFDDAASKKAAAEARKQRDLRRFGKQVQIAKEQERAKEKRATIDKINLLKRKRKDTNAGTTNEEDLFDVALEDAATEDQQSKMSRREGFSQGRNKRQKKDLKFGYGGKKRFAKSTDARSTGDLSNFSVTKMKGKKGSAKRLGKSRRGKLS